MKSEKNKRNDGIATVVIVGSGPAGLMAADVISGISRSLSVTVIEKRRSPGRKILIAGSSGLNVSNDLSEPEFASHYSGSIDTWSAPLRDFNTDAWLGFIHEIGHETFLGTSGRYFLKEMKAGPFVRSWKKHLDRKGVKWKFGGECDGVFLDQSGKWILEIACNGEREVLAADAVLFALGGASYEPDEETLRWPAIFKAHSISMDAFRPSNVGYRIDWPPKFLEECDGKPLKNIVLTTSRGVREGELVVTSYGIEGTPIYFVGVAGEAFIDLKPDLTAHQILERCLAVKENLSPIRRVGKTLNLCSASHALLFHLTPKEIKDDLLLLCQRIKMLPIQLKESQPMAEAISSAGGLSASEVDASLMLRRMPGVFVAGEMLSWDAPTGGFLLQGCVAQGAAAGRSITKWLGRSAPSAMQER